ncbi:MAG: xanthine dehydrogenase family protein subunit M [Pseudolabrys sp.]|nr:xanthine dehydrogenase family protein subunit M [Pseudolabrys sp.]
MQPFVYSRAEDAAAALRNGNASLPSAVESANQYLAGGTTLVDLMKLNVMRPRMVVDINALEKTAAQIELGAQGLRLGALARMSAVADSADIRKNFPVIAQSLELAASAQIRNMASLGGNVLQRTRCIYFRDTSYPNCNKRTPGSGCAALEGINRMHAVLGTSRDCIATYPGDFGQALIALDAQVEVQGQDGKRAFPFAQLHRQPGASPHIETTLKEGELITAFTIPALPFAKRSLYLKIRDRSSYEFALASAAVALDLEGDKVRDVRIALGGVATVPWRAADAEARLKGKGLDDQTLTEVANAAFAGATGHGHNDFKVELGKRTLTRALKQAAAMEIPT